MRFSGFANLIASSVFTFLDPLAPPIQQLECKYFLQIQSIYIYMYKFICCHGCCVQIAYFWPRLSPKHFCYLFIKFLPLMLPCDASAWCFCCCPFWFSLPLPLPFNKTRAYTHLHGVHGILFAWPAQKKMKKSGIKAKSNIKCKINKKFFSPALANTPTKWQLIGKIRRERCQQTMWNCATNWAALSKLFSGFDTVH